MAVEPETYEGTWEELAAQAARFTGRRVRVTVISEQAGASTDLSERYAFLKLPLSERRRLLSDQAERVRAHYLADEEWREWLQGDIIEY
jgi:hypothetical protein